MRRCHSGWSLASSSMALMRAGTSWVASVMLEGVQSLSATGAWWLVGHQVQRLTMRLTSRLNQRAT